MRSFALLLIVILCSSCATASARVPAYPAQGQSPEKIMQDKSECDTWAEQTTGRNTAGGAGTGAVVGGVIGATAGAVLGLVLGSFVGRAGEWAAQGAAVGATAGGLSGAAQGASSSEMTYVDAYKVCMLGRGYSVR